MIIKLSDININNNNLLEILENNVSNEFQILFCKNKIDKDKSYAWKKFNLYIKKLKNK